MPLLAFSGITYLIGVATAFLLRFASFLVDFAIDLQDKILTNELIEFGWTVVRDIANLGFVLVIIVIAFAVILRFREYGTQKLLFRLIAAAILVNFSLTIAGVFIDFTQVITNFFWSRISEQTAIGSSLMTALNPQKLFASTKTPSGLGEFVKILTGDVVAIIVGPLFIALFNIAAIFVFLTMAFLLLIRFIYLTFLLIISPIVWLFWVIPAFSGEFKKWWHNFFNWVFFAPASAFFIYLAFRSSAWLNSQKPLQNLEVEGMNDLIAGILTHGVNMILIIGILIGGLIAAKSMGVKAAEGAVKVAEKVGQGARKGLSSYAQQRATRTGAAAFASRPGQATTGAVGGFLGGVGTRMSALGANKGRFLRTITAPVRNTGNTLVGTARGMTGLTPRAQAVLQSPSPSLLGSVFKGVTGAFGIKQWQCVLCGNVYGPGKNPPPKCINPGCAVNTAGANQSWKGL